MLIFDFDPFFSQDLNLDFHLARTFDFAKIFYKPLNNNNFATIDLSKAAFICMSKILSISIERSKKCDRELYQELQKLSDRLPNIENQAKIKQWSQANGKIWTKDFRKILIEYRNIGHDWTFGDEQKELLERYYFANQLLIQCLHQDCYVSREVRQEIEETLLLPIAEIEKRKDR